MSANGQPELWIVVRNWERFQHYKDRRPTWIKIYTELLDDPNFLALTPGARSVLLGVWLQTARSRRAVPKNTAWLSRALHMKVSSQHLEALNHAGFIAFTASKPLAKPEQNASLPRVRTEEEEEREEENLLPAIASLSVQAGNEEFQLPGERDPWN